MFLCKENADLQKADIEKAQEYALYNTLRKEGKKFKWNCSVDEFLNCGVGIPLYLKFLKDMAIICVVLAIVAIPAIIGNRLGNGVKVYFKFILREKFLILF